MALQKIYFADDYFTLAKNLMLSLQFSILCRLYYYCRLSNKEFLIEFFYFLVIKATIVFRFYFENSLEEKDQENVIKSGFRMNTEGSETSCVDRVIVFSYACIICDGSHTESKC